jgi:hypothetical protein
MSLDVWPALPLLIFGAVTEDIVIAVLEHSDRICQFYLHHDGVVASQIQELWTAMQVPFPELLALYLSYEDLSYYWLVLPDSFLGGSAPHLRFLALTSVPFPGLPKLLLSATHLVDLWLENIPHSGYISPEAMATCLFMSTSLETLYLGFESPRSYPGPDLESRRPFPPARSVLPALTIFWFKGVSECFQEFVARIDAPQIYRLSTTFFINFGTPELNQFISRTPILGAYDEARLIFLGHEGLVKLRQSHPERRSGHRIVEVKILGQAPDQQLSNLAKICTLSLRLLLRMENLYIDGNLHSPLVWMRGIDSTEWLDVLLPFTAVKNLYLSKPFSPSIALALQELTGGRTTEVLPALQNVFLEGFQPSEPVHEGIAQFISVRQLTDHPVAISVWDRDLVRDKL